MFVICLIVHSIYVLDGNYFLSLDCRRQRHSTHNLHRAPTVVYMTQTIVKNSSNIRVILHKNLISVSGRELVSLSEVQDILLDLRNALVEFNQTAAVAFLDAEMKVWPKSSLVASHEVTNCLLDVQHKLVN